MLKKLMCPIGIIIITAFVLTTSHCLADVIKPDDQVTFELAAEGWVSTKSARVVVNLEAAVTSATAGNMRSGMNKAINDIVKSDWKLISFNRSQDQTGMERWSASYESRIAEAELNGLNEKAKNASKAGMQLRVSSIDFTPTLEETQAAIAQLRTQIYKQANEQLTTLNTAISGRTYRIAQINFTGGISPVSDVATPFRTMRAMASSKSMDVTSGAVAMPEMTSGSGMERSEKIIIVAQIVLAAPAPTTK